METKKFIQFGTFSVAIALPLLILFIFLSFTIGLEENWLLVLFGLMSLFMLFLLLMFYRMVIVVDQTSVSFILGIGLLYKKYPIDQLKDCRPVVNSLVYGIGIRPILNGLLYNVTGTKAIELTFNESEKVIRLGTDKPDEIAEMVMGILKKAHQPIDYSLTKRRNSQVRNQYILVGAVFAAIFLLTLFGNQDPKITVKNEYFVIGGMYGGSINYTDITQLDTVSRMPAIQMRTNGYAFGKICKGNFRLKEEGYAKIFVNFNSSPFIRMRLKSEKLFYINFKDRLKTITLFMSIRDKMH
jgi:hypothetical protein